MYFYGFSGIGIIARIKACRTKRVSNFFRQRGFMPQFCPVNSSRRPYKLSAVSGRFRNKLSRVLLFRIYPRQ